VLLVAFLHRQNKQAKYRLYNEQLKVVHGKKEHVTRVNLVEISINILQWPLYAHTIFVTDKVLCSIPISLVVLDSRELC
jgi:hypothetical protein